MNIRSALKQSAFSLDSESAVRAAVQGATCGLAIGVVLLIGGRLFQPPTAIAQAGRASAQTTLAQVFYVVDENGKRVVKLDKNGLEFFGANLRERVSLGRFGLEIQDPKLGDVKVDQNGLLIMSADRTTITGLEADQLTFFANNKIRLSLTTMEGIFPRFDLMDSTGKARLRFGIMANSPQITVQDESEKARAIFGSNVLENSETGTRITHPASLVIFSSDGKVVWKIPE